MIVNPGIEANSDNKRIGLLLPSANIVLEADLYRNIPPHWTTHTARMSLPETTVAGEERMLDEFMRPAARDIADVVPHLVIFGCTSAGAIRGIPYEAGLINELSAITNAPVVSVMQSVRQALQDLNANKLVVVTPYVEPVNQRIRANLEDDGYEVIKIDGMEIERSIDLGLVTAGKIIDFTREAVGKLIPDALFIACTNFPAMSVLPSLRGMFSFPVITSNQAIIERAVALLNNQ
jgi:maleate isomerase